MRGVEEKLEEAEERARKAELTAEDRARRLRELEQTIQAGEGHRDELQAQVNTLRDGNRRLDDELQQLRCSLTAAEQSLTTERTALDGLRIQLHETTEEHRAMTQARDLLLEQSRQRETG